jgi:2-hydroxycyclohexanecarboxyl-CoA dehydrogenase
MASVAVVTGGASGIGRAVAARLAEDGFDLALIDLNEAQAQDVAANLARDGRRAVACRADVTNRTTIAAAHDKIVDALGPVSVIVNCAGWSVVQPFLQNDEAFMQKAIDVNLMGVIAVTRVFLDDIIANKDGASKDGASKGGRIVNIASDAGRVGSTGEVVYAAAKGGVIAFTKSLAREVARYGIAVNCVCPGPTATQMLLVQDPKRIDALTRAIPMRRLAEPEDIAGAVAFFASPASAYITGQVLSVSGGLTMAG